MTRKTVRVRKGTMGGGGGTGLEQGKGYTCLSYCRLEVQFRQDQGITIFYRLGMGFMGQIVLSGDQEDRQGPKRYHGGGWGQCRVLAGKGTKWLSFDPFEVRIETGAGHNYGISIWWVFLSAIE